MSRKTPKIASSLEAPTLETIDSKSKLQRSYIRIKLCGIWKEVDKIR
jgi:hypothetical protein